MHILFSGSEEKNVKGLNIFNNKIKKISYKKNDNRFEKKIKCWMEKH